MAPFTREDAEALALSIEYGFADSADAVVWAGQLVAEEAEPSEHLLDLAGAFRPHPLDVVRLLRSFPGEADPIRVFRKVLARARSLLRKQPEAWPRVTHALEQMALHGDVPEAFQPTCYGLDDERLLAEQGTYGSVADVHAELLAFLDSEAEPL